MKVPFVDLTAQNAVIKKEFFRRFGALERSHDYILGADVKRFETDFAAYCGTRYAVGLNSGTDALFLGLKALGVVPGDEVIVPAFTFIATANAVSYCGATPVFCDIDPRTFCIDIESAGRVVTARTKAIIPVHLFGQCCAMDAVTKLAQRHGLEIVEDACQSHGAVYFSKSGKTKGVMAGSRGAVGCFSFYPTKNLSAWGDGGMAVTSDESVYNRLLMLRDCGRRTRYEHEIVGYNSRLDSIHAIVLGLKLKHLDSWNSLRARHAVQYTSLLSKIPQVECPACVPYSSHVFHIYGLRAQRRDELAVFLREKGIGVTVNYPRPLHLQQAYADLGGKRGDFPIAESVCESIISLPMHPFLTAAQIQTVCDTIRRFYRA
jgi:dTDP-4-amino-4,6-dideoxygalactose transaminase